MISEKVSDWESGLCPLVFIEVDVDDVSEAFPLKCVKGDKSWIFTAVRRAKIVEQFGNRDAVSK